MEDDVKPPPVPDTQPAAAPSTGEAPSAEAPKPFDLHARLKAQFSHLKE